MFVAARPGKLVGVAVWFDCLFMSREAKEDACTTVLDTSPFARPTHWFQTLIWGGVGRSVGTGDQIRYKLSFKQAKENSRFYEIEMEME